MVKKGETGCSILLSEYHRACLRYLVNLHSDCVSYQDIILWLLDNMVELEVVEPIKRKAKYGHQLYKEEKHILNLYTDKQRITNLITEGETY